MFDKMYEPDEIISQAFKLYVPGPGPSLFWALSSYPGSLLNIIPPTLVGGNATVYLLGAGKSFLILAPSKKSPNVTLFLPLAIVKPLLLSLN